MKLLFFGTMTKEFKIPNTPADFQKKLVKTEMEKRNLI